MVKRRLGLAALGFVVGGLLGGFAHMQLLFDAALTALERSGTSPWLFTTKAVGEEFFFWTYFYAVGVLIILLTVACFAVVKLFGAVGSWRRGTLTWPHRPSFAATTALIAGAALGALVAAISNIQAMTSIYADQLAIEEYFAVGSASAVPEMRALTSSFVAVAIAIGVGAAAAQIFKMRYRRAQV